MHAKRTKCKKGGIRENLVNLGYLYLTFMNPHLLFPNLDYAGAQLDSPENDDNLPKWEGIPEEGAVVALISCCHLA